MINQSSKISIIVPLYNVEQYLSCCIDSILVQSFMDFELLLIDDGSTDKSGIICNEYAKTDKRIKVFHKKNGGVTSARILGLEHASGDWIMFVDGDDTLESGAVETLNRYITKDINIIIGTFNYYINGEKKFTNNKSFGKYNADEYIDLLLLGKVYVAPWAKLYRKKILTNEMIELPNSIKNKEDFIMNMRIACSQRGNVYFVNEAIYNYRYGRNDSALTKYKSNINLQYELKIKNYIIEALKKYNMYKAHEKYISYYYFNILWYLKDTYKNLTINECHELLKMLNESRVKKKTIKSLFEFILVKLILIKEIMLVKYRF